MIVSFKDADTETLAGGARWRPRRQHGIRMSDQYRVCFRWTAAGPGDVEILDYHEEHGDAQAQARDARRAAA